MGRGLYDSGQFVTTLLVICLFGYVLEHSASLPNCVKRPKCPRMDTNIAVLLRILVESVQSSSSGGKLRECYES